MEFIEESGYLSLMLGLIMIVLGFSVPLLMGMRKILKNLFIEGEL